MKMYINGSIKEFKGIKINAKELIIQLNLNGKRFAIEKNGATEPHRKNVYFVDPDGFEVEFVQYFSDLPEQRNSGDE